MMSAAEPTTAQQGFTLVELAVVIVSLLMVPLSVMVQRVIATQQRVGYESNSLMAQLLEYSPRNNRLPCAVNGDENCRAAGSGLPYSAALKSRSPLAFIGATVRHIHRPSSQAPVTITPRWQRL